MLLAQLLTLDLYLQQVQLMMHTLLPQMVIYIFGMALLGRVSVRSSGLLVQLVLELQAQQELLVQQVLLVRQVQMELSVLTVLLVQLVQQAQDRLAQLVQLV